MTSWSMCLSIYLDLSIVFVNGNDSGQSIFGSGNDSGNGITDAKIYGQTEIMTSITHNRLVVGSNPTGATRYQGLTCKRRPFSFSAFPEENSDRQTTGLTWTCAYADRRRRRPPGIPHYFSPTLRRSVMPSCGTYCH